MQKSRGKISKHSRKLKKSHREKGLRAINRYLKTFEKGERVSIAIDSSENSGMPHPRFQGRSGVVKGKQGSAYLVEIRDGGKQKVLLVSPVHLKPIK
ncbi:MAG: 50S ribosomal protein L21e [Candidatus Diapherotrites archaeon]|nr:50S ribosomal protein L21e [Candidatus Diapherotrites archaeon]